MQLIRPAFAPDSRHFGRGLQRELPAAPQTQPSRVAEDLKLFAMTFLAGFVFVSVLLA